MNVYFSFECHNCNGQNILRAKQLQGNALQDFTISADALTFRSGVSKKATSSLATFSSVQGYIAMLW